MEENYTNPITSKPTQSKDWLYTMSKIISGIFTPFMVPTLSFIILFFFTYLRIMPLSYKLTILIMVYCFTFLLPLAGILLLQKVNGWGIHGLGLREKRILPYGMTLLSYATCLFTMYNMHLPRYMSGIIVAVIICVAACTIINFRFKISTHMASCGMMVGGLLSFSLIFHFNPLFWLSLFILLSGLLGSARIIVRQHSIHEVNIGFLVGLICGVTGILYI